MTKKPISFRERMDLARPDVVECQKRNYHKSTIALQLRVLRDARGMTQGDVAQATGTAIHHIERMESLIGPIPDIKDLECYVDACHPGSQELESFIQQSNVFYAGFTVRF
jgi:hypothetical protein